MSLTERLRSLARMTIRYHGFNDGMEGIPARETNDDYLEGYNKAIRTKRKEKQNGQSDE